MYQGPMYFSFGEGGGVLYFCYFHCVPVKFSLSSQHVFKFSMYSPNMFPIALDFIPYSLLQILLLKTYISNPMEEFTYIYLGLSDFIFIYFDELNKDAHHKKEKIKKLWGFSQPINISRNILSCSITSTKSFIILHYNSQLEPIHK